MTKVRLLLLLVIAVFALGACGGGDDLTEEQIENAFKASFTGDTGPLEEIACDAEKEGIKSSAAAMPEGTDVTIDCSIDGDVATCSGNMTMTVEGADPVESPLPEFKIKIDDGKLCGSAE